MSGFSNSLGYLIFTASMPSEFDIPIHTFSNFTKVSRFVSSLDHQYQSIIAYLQYLQFCNNLWWTVCRKSLPNLSTHLPLRRYTLPSNLQWTQIRDDSKPEPETRVWPFPNPKTRVYKRNPGLETLATMHNVTDGDGCKLRLSSFVTFYMTLNDTTSDSEVVLVSFKVM